nr:hypothetical protein [Sulfolobus islandicus]
MSGHNCTYVLEQLQNPHSLVYKEIYSEANLITEMICKVDGYKPYNVCSHFMQDSSNSSPLYLVPSLSLSCTIWAPFCTNIYYSWFTI